MSPSFLEDASPAVDDGVRNEHHAPFFTYNPLDAVAETPAAVSIAAQNSFSSDSIVGKPLQLSTWTTSRISHPSAATATPSESLSSLIATPEPTNSISESAESAAMAEEGPLGKGVKAGVIAGIVVVAFLLFLALMLCAIDCRKRHNKKRTAGRASELNVLEAEMRNGRAKQMNESKTKLWAGLQYGRTDNEPSSEGRSINSARFSKGSRREGALWERVSEMRSQEMGNIRKESHTMPSNHGHKREFRWMPAHIPGERASLVSSAGSLNFPVSAKPAAPKSFLDGGLRW